MTGRGIDQILPNPSDLQLFEPYVTSALTYVELAEHVAGPIPRGVAFEYVWGDALKELERVHPDARIINLETAVTTSPRAWPNKAIHYRLHPANLPCLSAAKVDCCVLANNHVMDWGRPGLEETLVALHAAGIHTAGAGRDAAAAAAPAAIDCSGGQRVLVFAYGMQSSGVLPAWRATREEPGINWLSDLSAHSIDSVGQHISQYAQQPGVIVASIHWGNNWGYEISHDEREFAHRLIDTAGVDVVHGHSSHHAKGIEVYGGKLILYGCGDLLNDYEGIGGHEEHRGDLGVMYFPTLDAGNGNLLRLSMTPTRTQRFRLHQAPAEATAWMCGTLDRECRKLGTRIRQQSDGTLSLQWDA